MTLRRHITLYGNRVRAQAGFRTNVVDVAEVLTAALTVRSGRISEVSLTLGDGRSTVRIPLALYTAGGWARVGDPCTPQARGRAGGQRVGTGCRVVLGADRTVACRSPRRRTRRASALPRVELVTAEGRVPRTTLTDHEVAGLLD